MKTKNRIRIYPVVVMGILLMLTISCKKDQTVNNPSNTVTDKDGNVYHTVTIGMQVWMVENLKTTKYNDGSTIPLVIDNTAWSNLTTGGYCWYNNDSATFKNAYGTLYNWYAVNTGKLCPTGWHVATDAEWTILTTYLGGDSVASGKLKEVGTTHWEAPNTGAVNSSGFTAVAGGYRNYAGPFYSNGNIGYFWSAAAEYDANSAFSRYLSYNSNLVSRYGYSKKNGFSVRCIKE